MGAQFERAAEEHLGGDGEELSGVDPGVVPEHRRPVSSTNRAVGRGADSDPAAERLGVIERRRSVDHTVEHVELMRELVEHDVVAALREGAPLATAGHDSSTGPR